MHQRNLDFSLRLIVLITGICLALVQYFFNRSFWSDEASLALNIIEGSYIDLLKPLKYNQVAPPLFLIVSKFFYETIPHLELSLRLISLLLFCGSITVLFFLTELLFKSTTSRVISLSLIAFSHLHIYFSSEYKQYIGDVFFVFLGIYLAHCAFESNRIKITFYLIYGIFFCLFSHISAFFLPSLILYLLLEDYQKNGLKNFILIVSIGVVFFLFLLAQYLLIAYGHPSENYMTTYWVKFYGFLSFSPVQKFFGFFEFHFKVITSRLTFSTSIYKLDLFIFFILLLTGFYGLQKRLNPLLIILFFLPIFIHLLFSSLHLYPVSARLFLYGISVILLFFGFAIDLLEEIISARFAEVSKITLSVPFLLFALFFIRPYKIELGEAPVYFPFRRDEIRSALDYLREKASQGDKLLVHHLACRNFLFYQESNNHFGLSDYRIMPPFTPLHQTNPIDTSLIKSYTDSLKGKIWILYCRTTNKEIEVINKYFENKGNGRKVFDTTNTFLYFYQIPEASNELTSK